MTFSSLSKVILSVRKPESEPSAVPGAFTSIEGDHVSPTGISIFSIPPVETSDHDQPEGSPESSTPRDHVPDRRPVDLIDGCIISVSPGVILTGSEDVSKVTL